MYRSFFCFWFVGFVLFVLFFGSWTFFWSMLRFGDFAVHLLEIIILGVSSCWGVSLLQAIEMLVLITIESH